MRRPRRSLPELPHEILAQEILPRLPAKSLRRFKFVCKRWRDLINDPTFIDTHLLHLNHQPTSNQQINVLYTNQGRIYSRIIKLDFLSSIQVLRNPLPSADWFQPRKHVEPSFWGSCNGLVCVRTDDSLGLWNPCTGSYRALDYDPLLGPASHGFGYDANTKDYKLVVISEKQLYMGNVITPQVIRVFSLNSNSWRTLSDSVYPCSWMESGMFIDGVVYWVKFEKVICFDIHAEVFSELRLPDISFSELRLRLPDISPTHKICKIQISEIGGSLAISYLLNCIFHEVWVMVKENWIKMYSVDVLQNPHWLNDLKPLGGIKVINKRKNEKKENHVVDRVIYMREYSSRSSFSFNPSTNHFTSFPFPNASYVALCPSLTTYVESLVSVNREKRSS